MQLNSQLMPAPRRRRAGFGAPTVVLQPGDFFTFTIDVSQGGNPVLAIPADFNASGFGGNYSGRYMGSSPYSLFPGSFSYVATNNYGSAQNPNYQNVTYTYKVLSASALAPAPVVLHAPTPPAPAPPHIVFHQLGPSAPAPSGASSIVTSAGATKYGAGVFTFVPGHRIQAATTASGGAMPPDFTGVTPQSLQATVGAGYSVVSVTYPSPLTLVVVYDYTGPNKTIGAPVTFASGAVTMTTVYTDMGVSPGGSTASSSSKTPYYVAGGVALAALGAGAYWKWGRK